MKSLALETFLIDTSEGKSIDGPIDILEVSYWQLTKWKYIHSLALSRICHRLKVRQVFFKYQANLSGDWLNNIFSILATYTKDDCPLLSNLREIKIAYTEGAGTPCWDLFRNSHVRRLTWDMTAEENWQEDDEREDKIILSELTRIINNFSASIAFGKAACLYFREIFFVLPWLPEPVQYTPDGPLDITLPGRTLLENLERNKICFKKCLDATIVILGLRRRKEFVRNRDVLGVIAGMIWGTKFTVVWAQ